MTVTMHGSPAIGDFDGADLDMLIRKGFRPVPVSAVRKLTPEVIGIELTLTEAAELGSAPGAHLEVAVPLPDGPAIRHYSLLAGPADSLRVAVLRITMAGAVLPGCTRISTRALPCSSAALATPSATRGAAPHISSPGHRHHPLTAMIAAAVDARRDWHLLYVGRRLESMAFADALIEEYGPDRVTIHITEAAGRPDVVSAVEDWASAYDEPTTVYTCGPVSLMRALEIGFDDHSSITVISENFDDHNEVAAQVRSALPLGGTTSASQSCNSPTAPHATEATAMEADDDFVVELGDGSEIDVPPGCSIIDALKKAGVRTLSSCQKGTCGTCETVILDGRADHRDSVLSAEEHAAHETMMICVSRACGKRIALDL